MMRQLARGVLGLAVVVVTLWTAERAAEACGCLSPPAVREGDYAVNQSAEQLIFEVEPNYVTAHVLIKYAGAPDKFAWIIPAPEVPELGISPASTFGLLDRLTAPSITVRDETICPISEWSCRYHETPSCGAGDDNDPAGGIADAGASASDAGGAGEPPVTVIDTQVVGDYQTVTFRASEASAATQWLRDNGFIVNQTTSIYMEPYVQSNFVFVAIKLVPGAGIDAIKPLKMRYQAAFPMIPLVLTAVAAQPHLTINAYVFANEPYRPMGHPIVELDAGRIANDHAGRTNYPQVLARTIDEAGGDAFAIEYRGATLRPEFGQTPGGGPSCCGSDYDFCYLGNNTQCECPRDAWDRADCATQGDLLDGVALADDLAARHATLTRITTRISAEEMQFDPTFEPHYGAAPIGRMTLTGTQVSLKGCREDVIDQTRYAAIDAQQACAATYCGPNGHCVVTDSGEPACACAEDFVAQRFLDLDTRPSVTCVPRVPPVDLRADGRELPDACATASCGAGQCIDRNGIAVCDCDSGAGAVVGLNTYPTCAPIRVVTGSPGAQDYSEPLRELEVCAPPPPSCGPHGWLVKTGSPRVGVDCGDARPAAPRTVVPAKPTCGDSFGPFGCGGCQQDDRGTAPVAALLVLGGFFAFGTRRRRARGGR